MKRSESDMSEVCDQYDRGQNKVNDYNSRKKFNSKNGWTFGLLNAIKDDSLIVSKDDSFTVIKDKYPKARHHYLVIPNEDISVEEVRSLERCHIQLIDYMQIRGKQVALKNDVSIEFRFGFHLNPSLKPLHLHVISQDFDSKYLKTKKHYNSFTTQFFIDSKTVIEQLKNYGKVQTISREEADTLLKQDIICHFCRLKLANIPKLKTHLLTHYPKTN